MSLWCINTLFPCEKKLKIITVLFKAFSAYCDLIQLYLLGGSGSMRKSDQQHHSTFFIQSLFFVLVFVENMLLASWPLIKGGSNRALACLGPEKLIDYLFMVSGLCGASWICHILYYKYMGHPWTEINGPQISK